MYISLYTHKHRHPPPVTGDAPLEDASESGDAESAADTASTARGGRSARKGRGQWDRKPVVIEQLNELIEGLDNVAEVCLGGWLWGLWGLSWGTVGCIVHREWVEEYVGV